MNFNLSFTVLQYHDIEHAWKVWGKVRLGIKVKNIWGWQENKYSKMELSQIQILLGEPSCSH